MTFLSRELAANGVDRERVTLRAYRMSIRCRAADVAALAGVSMQTVLVFERGGLVQAADRIADSYARLVPVPDYSEALRAFRKVRGWTVERCAQVAGIEPRSWSQIERRGHSYAPTPEMRAKLDAVLGGSDVCEG